MAKIKAKFRLEPPLTQVLLGGEVYAEGDHEVSLSAAEAKELASHVAAGGVFLIEGSLPDVIEADEASLKKQAAAQKNGSWQEGNLLDFMAVEAQKAAAANDSEPDEVED